MYLTVQRISMGQHFKALTRAQLAVQDFPAKWIYEPWKAPVADQKNANCRIGIDYPKPMVDHATVSKANIQKIKDAYADPSLASRLTSPQAPSGTALPAAAAAAAAAMPGTRVSQTM